MAKARALKNITITLDSDTASRARTKAAERNMSLSRFIGEVLRKELRYSREYEQALQRFLTQKPVRLKRPGGRYLTREEAHDRSGLRRR
jgi:CelD/BcsL family acetyltransferase involved in cellulose biosynthesis